MALIGVFTGLSLANYYLTNQSQTLTGAKVAVLEQIRLARQQSSSGQIYSDCVIDSFLGFGLTVDVPTNTVSLTYFCPTVAAAPIHTIPVATRYRNVQISSLTSGGVPITNFYFKRLTGVTSTGADVTLCLHHTQLSKYSKFIIRASGIIDTYDNQTTCP